MVRQKPTCYFPAVRKGGDVLKSKKEKNGNS